MTLLYLVHAAATLAMTGLIWFVQIVHYPLFRYAEPARFAAFSAAYRRRTTWVVLPIMGLELATAALIAWRPPPGSMGLALWGLVLLAVIWLSTALVQVPLHQRLIAGFDEATAARLVASNWLRTAAWSARSILALRLLAG